MRELAVTGFPVSICYPDERTGALIVGIPRLEPGLAGHYRRLLRPFAGDVPIRVTRCGLARRHAAKKELNRPLVGGLWITTPIDSTHNELGSIGVCAMRGAQSGFVTAGHVAGAVNKLAYQPRHSSVNDWKAGKTVKISTFTTSAHSDSGFLADETGGAISRDRIWESKDTLYTVTGTAAPARGETVHMQGAGRVDERSGLIRAAAATVTFDDGGVLQDQYLANYESHEGDSGAPVYVKDTGHAVRLVGLNVGATNPADVSPPVDQALYPPAPNGTYAIISKWHRIEADLGVTR
jgi:hypothetical protein